MQCKNACMSTLAERVQERMTETGVTVREIAEAAGISVQAVYAVVNGVTLELKGPTWSPTRRRLRRTKSGWKAALGQRCVSIRQGTHTSLATRRSRTNHVPTS